MASKLEKNQLNQINEVSLFAGLINAILKRKTDKKARELKKDPKIADAYKNMENAIHDFQRQMDVYVSSTSKMLSTYGPSDEKDEITKEWDKKMKKMGPSIYKKWKKLNR